MKQYASLLFFGLKETKLLIFIISELNDKVDLAETKSSYSFGNNFESTLPNILVQNLAMPFGFLDLSALFPLYKN